MTVPLRADGDSFTADGRGDVVGALDVYLPYRPIADAIADDTRTLALTIAVGFGVLYLVLLRLIASASSRLRRQSDETMFQANHDPLTGLPNRRSLLAWMAERLPLARPHGAAMALIDLDRFKEINDTLGHVHGDELLQRVGRRLRDAFDSETMVARLGGDEYAVVAMREGSGGEAVDLANRVSRALARPMLIDGVEIAVRASVGLAVAPDDGDDAETLLQRADMAMYVAKQTNSRYRRFEPALDVYSPERFRLAADVRRAMDAGEFFLAYQPKVSFADRSVHGVEALVRWRHPERGIINPTEFLPVIENTELIGPLTYHLLDLALGQAAEWHRMGLDVPVAVNLSARTLLDPELPARLNAALSRFAVPPSVLELELTESAVLADPDEASVALGVLKQLGFSLAVDDFGTGYASLAYLISLPVDVVKIDMSFARHVTTDRQAAAIVRFTVDLARHLDLQVVAEGVEDSATFLVLDRLGCDLAQGYLISRPVTGQELTTWFRTSGYPVPRLTAFRRPTITDADLFGPLASLDSSAGEPTVDASPANAIACEAADAGPSVEGTAEAEAAGGADGEPLAGAGAPSTGASS